MDCPHCKKDISTIYVRVIVSQESFYWYHKEIGNVFEVFKETVKDDYILVDSVRQIAIKDAEVVKVIS